MCQRIVKQIEKKKTIIEDNLPEEKRFITFFEEPRTIDACGGE